MYQMPRRCWNWGLVWAIGSVLVAGCSSMPATHHAKPAEAAAPASANSPAADWPEEKIAQAHAHYGAGVIHDMNDEGEAACEEYCQAALDDPDNETLVLEVSDRFIHNKKPEKALEILSLASSRPKASGAIFARLGIVYAMLGKPDQAAAADRTAIKRSPILLAGYQNLFVGFMQARREEEALRILAEAGRQPSSDPDFFITLAELYRSYLVQSPAQKDRIRPKALAALNQALKLGPTALPLRVRLAEGFVQAGATGQAAQIYQNILKDLPDTAYMREPIRAKLAEIYLQDSDHQRAAEQLQAIAHDDPTNPRIYYYLGLLTYEDKKPAEAADYFSRTILLSPDFKDAYFDMALAQISQDKPGEALATLETARKKFPASFALEFYTGLAYSREKSYAEALRHFTIAETIARASEPKHLDADLYFQLGAAAERTGDIAQAEKHFLHCLELAPGSPEAENYLGYTWAEHGIKLDQARELLQKAVKADPKNPAYLDSLAWVYFKLKQPREGLAYEQKAVALSKNEPDDSTLYDHLGDIYAALRQMDKARAAWTKSLSLESNDEVRKKLEGRASMPPTAD